MMRYHDSRFVLGFRLNMGNGGCELPVPETEGWSSGKAPGCNPGKRGSESLSLLHRSHIIVTFLWYINGVATAPPYRRCVCGYHGQCYDCDELGSMQKGRTHPPKLGKTGKQCATAFASNYCLDKHPGVRFPASPPSSGVNHGLIERLTKHCPG